MGRFLYIKSRCIDFSMFIGKGEGVCSQVTLRRMHRPPQARSRYLPHAAVRKMPQYGI